MATTSHTVGPTPLNLMVTLGLSDGDEIDIQNVSPNQVRIGNFAVAPASEAAGHILHVNHEPYAIAIDATNPPWVWASFPSIVVTTTG